MNCNSPKPIRSERILRTLPSVSFLIFICALLLSGCSDKSVEKISSKLINSLADTIYAGEDRLVLLTDGTGGYYYGDALKAADESCYGYSHREYRLLSGWGVSNLAGEPINGNVSFTIADPSWVERHYEGGLVERNDMPHGRSGIYIDLKRDNSDGFIFRPLADFRHFELIENARYVSRWDEEFHTLSFAREDGYAGWVAIACPKNVSYREFELTEPRQYRVSELKGRPGAAILWSPGEFQVGSASATFAVGYGKDRYAAEENARFLMSNQDQLRSERDVWLAGILKKVHITCNDQEFMRAFSWARLTLAKMIYKTETTDTFLLTGIPESPYPDGWFTCLTLPGLVASGIDRDVSVDVFNSILKHQNTNEFSQEFGMYPGQIRDERTDYQIPEIAGLAVLAYQKIFPVDSDTVYADKFATSIAKSLLGTMKYRLQHGLASSDKHQNFLGDSPAAVDRSGATIETQVLLQKVREFIKKYPRLDSIPVDIPVSLIKGAGGLERRTLDAPLVTVGGAGEFDVPLLFETALSPFRMRKDKFWADRLIFPDEGDTIIHPYPSYDSRISMMLALDFYDSGNHKRAKEAYKYAVDQELFGDVGFRTMSPFEDNYQSSHAYREHNSPRGTKSKGDVLVWSDGVLGNILANAEQLDSLWALMDRMNHRVLHQGLTGALPEAENAETVDILRNIVGSSVFVTSTAEYVRLVSEHILGIESVSGAYMTFRPRFPQHWGETRLEVKHSGGMVIIERDEKGIFRVSQHHIEPHLQLALEVSPEPGMRALGSVRLYPDEEAEIEFVLTKNGRYSPKIRKDI